MPTDFSTITECSKEDSEMVSFFTKLLKPGRLFGLVVLALALGDATAHAQTTSQTTRTHYLNGNAISYTLYTVTGTCGIDGESSWTDLYAGNFTYQNGVVASSGWLYNVEVYGGQSSDCPMTGGNMILLQPTNTSDVYVELGSSGDLGIVEGIGW
jgi:hypothetical protein